MNQSNTVIKAFPVTIFVTIVAGVIIYLVSNAIDAVSFALGSTTMLMTMSMLVKATNRVILQEVSKVDAQKMTVRNYVFRYFFYILVLVISAMHPNINVIFTAIGLFVFKICLYGIILFEKRGGQK